MGGDLTHRYLKGVSGRRVLRDKRSQSVLTLMTRGFL